MRLQRAQDIAFGEDAEIARDQSVPTRSELTLRVVSTLSASPSVACPSTITTGALINSPTRWRRGSYRYGQRRCCRTIIAGITWLDGSMSLDPRSFLSIAQHSARIPPRCPTMVASTIKRASQQHQATALRREQNVNLPWTNARITACSFYVLTQNPPRPPRRNAPRSPPCAPSSSPTILPIGHEPALPHRRNHEPRRGLGAAARQRLVPPHRG